MVVVAVALWTLYQQHLNEQQGRNEKNSTAQDDHEAAAEGEGEADTTKRDDGSPSRRIQSLVQQGSSFIMEQALSCSSPAVYNTEDDGNIVNDDENYDDHENTSARQLLPDVFLDSVKQDWMTAVFGQDGIAGPCVSYTATIPPAAAAAASKSGLGRNDCKSASNDSDSQRHDGHDDSSSQKTSNNKLGMTICKYPLGVHVKHVQVGSEAFLAGIRPGYILVALNGMHFLGEPSAKALERLWHYEYGMYSMDMATATTSAESDPASTAASAAAVPSSTPISMTFFHQGALHTIILLSRPPFGITWAPCVNVPLIKRVAHGQRAKNAGIQPGGLLLHVATLATDPSSPSETELKSVNFWTADHVEMAQALTRAAAESTVTIQISCGYTPRSSRTNDFERRIQRLQEQQAPSISMNNNTPAPPSQQLALFRGFGSSKNQTQVLATKSYDGVHVKFHSLDFGLCASRMLFPSHLAGGSYENRSKTISMAPSSRDLAALVAAGLAEGPRSQPPHTFGASLPIQLSAILPNALLPQCSPVYSACPTLDGCDLLQAWDPLESLVYCMQLALAKFDEVQLCSIIIESRQDTAAMNTLKKLARQSASCLLVGTFLLQFVGIICAPIADIAAASDDGAYAMDNASRKHTRISGNMVAQELTAILLRLARDDQEFRQKLYFLLRSYISTFETPHPCQDGSRNLTALLSCLEPLRFAENELANRHSPKMNDVLSRPVWESHSDPRLIRASSDGGAISHLPSTISPSDRQRVESSLDWSVTSNKTKGLFARFRKKKGEKSQPECTVSLGTPYSPTFSTSLNAPSYTKESHRRHRVTAPSNASQTQISRSVDFLTHSPSTVYNNMSDFIGELDRICQTVERSLQKSFRQKMADWAMQPWSPSKDTALAQVTQLMRNSLKEVNRPDSDSMLLVNPVDSSELLSSVDFDECYILPSAHFPILLTFNVSERRSSDLLTGEERLYRTKVELVALKGYNLPMDRSYIIHGAVSGTVLESGSSSKLTADGKQQTWRKDKTLIFDSRSSWGAPQTLSLRLSSRHCNDDGSLSDDEVELGFGWLDLSQQFVPTPAQDVSMTICTADMWAVDPGVCSYDEHGAFHVDGLCKSDRFALEMKVTTESIGFGNDFSREAMTRKRMLLYKHDDDLRQEAFATQFVAICGSMLKACGLDMKLLSFQCVPVGSRRGFVEWVPGSVPLSEICQPPGGSPTPADNARPSVSDMNCPSMFSKAGLTKYESLRRLGGQQNGTLRRLSGQHNVGEAGSFMNNPIQDYLRSVAYDAKAPYMIRKDVMDTYIKSVAGYSVITYILGVGDRHLDNLLLHQSGAFFHCDYSFILGSDPKTYLPVRVTEDMVHGMGGRESDNYVRFLTTVGAAFLVLRRPENARALLSLVRMMEYSCVPDISENQSTDQAVLSLRDRLKLDLSDQDAVAYIEELVESSQSSTMWKAVDVVDDSPAHAAGLQIDDAIVSFDGICVSESSSDVAWLLQQVASRVARAAASNEPLVVVVVRRSAVSNNGSGQSVEVNSDNGSNAATRFHQLELRPRPWAGRGLLGCHMVPVSN